MWKRRGKDAKSFLDLARFFLIRSKGNLFFCFLEWWTPICFWSSFDPQESPWHKTLGLWLSLDTCDPETKSGLRIRTYCCQSTPGPLLWLKPLKKQYSSCRERTRIRHLIHTCMTLIPSSASGVNHKHKVKNWHRALLSQVSDPPTPQHPQPLKNALKVGVLFKETFSVPHMPTILFQDTSHIAPVVWEESPLLHLYP